MRWILILLFGFSELVACDAAASEPPKKKPGPKFVAPRAMKAGDTMPSPDVDLKPFQLSWVQDASKLSDRAATAAQSARILSEALRKLQDLADATAAQTAEVRTTIPGLIESQQEIYSAAVDAATWAQRQYGELLAVLDGLKKSLEIANARIAELEKTGAANGAELADLRRKRAELEAGIAGLKKVLSDESKRAGSIAKTLEDASK